jgi:RNA polymerase sigma-70 factor (ECF subfamily)
MVEESGVEYGVAGSTPTSSRDEVREAWFSSVYKSHVAYVWHTLRRLGVPEKDRADLAQDVFVVVHRHQDAYDPTRPLRPWLFGIAFRIARRHADKHAQRFEVLTDALEPFGAEARESADTLVEQNRTRQRMNTALRALDDAKRTVFLLCEVEGLSVPQAAALLEENVNTVGARLRAARLQLTEAVRSASALPQRGPA